ncbi:MAG: porin, partial [Planctomycetales bacterium]
MKYLYCRESVVFALCGLLAGIATGQTRANRALSQPVIRAVYQDDEPSRSPSEPDEPETPTRSPSENGEAQAKSACGDPCGDPCCDPCDNGCSCYLFGPDEAWTFANECEAIQIGGWTQIGYHDGINPLGFNNRPNEIALHQSWAYAEKVADGRCGPDWGFRADIVYGIDGADTQAFGNSPGNWDFMNGFDHGAYSWAIPQLYGEFATGDLSVKVGQFFTLVGYEVVTAPDNFFYSHAYTMYNSEPFTHTGALATYQVSDDVTAYGGWTLGWDTGFDNGPRDGSSWLGGVSVSVSDDLTVTYISTAGNLGVRGDGYSHSLVADWQVSDDLNYVVQSDFVSTNAAAANDQVGINQYLFYTVSDCVAVGGRLEWWKSDGTSVYGATYGINYRPAANLVLRPEIRHQWPAQNNTA